MSVKVISSRKVTARKRHRCTWCGEWIEAGQRYTKEFVKVDDDPSWNILHPECDEALTEAARLEGGSCTYTEYGMERPADSASRTMVPAIPPVHSEECGYWAFGLGGKTGVCNCGADSAANNGSAE